MVDPHLLIVQVHDSLGSLKLRFMIFQIALIALITLTAQITLRALIALIALLGLIAQNTLIALIAPNCTDWPGSPACYFCLDRPNGPDCTEGPD